MPKTIRQSVQSISKPKQELEVATIIGVDVLARDAAGVILSVAPSITANVHSIGGLQRIELSGGIDPLKLNIGDQIFVTRVQDRYIGVAPLPISNRTQGGGESDGAGEAMEFIGQVQSLGAVIAGSSLELAWEPVQGAQYYEIWASESADPSSEQARVVARTPNTTWTGKASGQLFDDSVYYSVVPRFEGGIAGQSGAFADWVQPTFVGNYASGMTSKNQTTNIPGSLTVTKSGSILRADVTSLDSPATFAVDVCDPQGAHPTAAPFSVNDILRMVDAGGNVLWVKIDSAHDNLSYWTYTVKKQSPSAGTNYTILSGAQVANWGQSGQGVFIVSSDGTFGAGTLWAIVTHAGAPWVTYTVQVKASSDGGLLINPGGAQTLRWENDSFPNAAYISVNANLTTTEELNVVNEDGTSDDGSATTRVFNSALEAVVLSITTPLAGRKTVAVSGADLLVNQAINLAASTTPPDPASSSDGNVYVKGGKLILQYNDGGTVRWKYLDLTGTGVTWVHSLVAP